MFCVSFQLQVRVYICGPDAPAFTTESGQTVKPITLLDRPIKFIKSGRDGTAYFETERGTKVQSKCGDLSKCIGLTQTALDAEIVSLRKTYLGKNVWSYGGGQLRFDTPSGGSGGELDFNSSQSIVVDGIFRLVTPDSVNDGPTMQQVKPILFLLRGVKDQPVTSAWLTGGKLPANPLSLKSFGPPYCLFSGAWQIQHRFSLVPPKGSNASAAKLGTPKVGMTHRQVAWAIGFPPLRKSKEEIERLNRWDYPATTPFQSTVIFKGDRVIQYDPPGMLP